MKTAVLIVAGGSGSRMGAGLPKQFLPLAGMPVIVHTVTAFSRLLPKAEVFVALPEQYHSLWKKIAVEYGLESCTVCKGGRSRFETVRNSLEAMEPCDILLVHDAVRPLITQEVIDRVMEGAAANGACIPVTVPVDSFRRIAPEGSSTIIDRSTLRSVQTPQGFSYPLLKLAYSQPFSENFTDDASVVENYGHPISLCEGSPRNIKITYPEDLLIAEALLKNGEKA